VQLEQIADYREKIIDTGKEKKRKDSRCAQSDNLRNYSTRQGGNNM
jgi:hypothetical protein